MDSVYKKNSGPVALVLKSSPRKLFLRRRRIHSGRVVYFVQIIPKVSYVLYFLEMGKISV